MHTKGKLESEGSRTCLTANIDGRVYKSWLVDQEGTIHVFTKVSSLAPFNTDYMLKLIRLWCLLFSAFPALSLVKQLLHI